MKARTKKQKTEQQARTDEQDVRDLILADDPGRDFLERLISEPALVRFGRGRAAALSDDGKLTVACRLTLGIGDWLRIAREAAKAGTSLDDAVSKAKMLTEDE
jgi:hypothetical protein